MSTDWKQAQVRAIATDRRAETLCKALAKREAKRWQFISFRGPKKGEWKGVVDLIAIRKDTTQTHDIVLRRGDLFDVILVQVKGGRAASPSDDDVKRLRSVAKRYGVTAVVKFRWVNGKKSVFSVLDGSGDWVPSTARDIFG